MRGGVCDVKGRGWVAWVRGSDRWYDMSETGV